MDPGQDTQTRPFFGLSAMLALVMTCLVLVSLAWPVPGSAAPASDGRETAPPQAVTQGTLSPAHTVYLPLIIGNELTPNLWQAEYYANRYLDDDPEYTLEETRVDYDWGTGGPAGLPTDYFSVRWTGDWEFEAGEYTFFAYADDGIRLYLDDDPVPIIESWVPGMGSYQATTDIEAAGLHRLRLEYFENTGDAAVRLHWRRTDLYPQWHGDYYREPWVEFEWAYEQYDSAIQFDWRDGGPEDLPVDGFSIAWEATPLLLTGTHRIHLYADDGYQLFVDGGKVEEGGWYDGQGGSKIDVTHDLYVAGPESHQITYNFKDWGGLAEARLWIEDLAHGDWDVEYYSNPDLIDPPLKTDTDKAVFYDWGLGAPEKTGLPSDRFSIRWAGDRHFQAGCYRFGLFVDDGARLWVDGELLVDEWLDGRSEYYSPVTFLTTGYHDIVIEYYENTGEAEIRFWWE